MNSPEVIATYLIDHLYNLYSQWDGYEGEPMWDYIDGSIETTQHYLSKMGFNYMEFEQYKEERL